MSLETKLIILKYLAQGLKFLKDQGIYHLDIKPSNVLFGSTHVKITDFGESYHRDVCARGKKAFIQDFVQGLPCLMLLPSPFSQHKLVITTVSMFSALECSCSNSSLTPILSSIRKTRLRCLENVTWKKLMES